MFSNLIPISIYVKKLYCRIDPLMLTGEEELGVERFANY